MCLSPRAHILLSQVVVSRFGVNPKPTVRQQACKMARCESPDKREREFYQRIVCCARHALILVTTGDCHESDTSYTANRR